MLTETGVKGARLVITILVVDDEPLVVSLIQRAASQMGYEVIGTANPFEALEILQDPSRPISVLLTDLMMPGLNGRELARWAAQLREGLPVIYMSGYDDIDPGGDENPESKCAVLSKPFRVSELLTLLAGATNLESVPR